MSNQLKTNNMAVYNSERKQTTFVKMKAKTSDTDLTPIFGVLEKSGDSWVIGKVCNAISGELTEITHKTYEYEGEEKNSCRMKFVDPDGSANLVESGFNNLLYNVLNILAFKNDGNIVIELGLSKPDANNKRYARAYITINGEKSDWKYKDKEIPRPSVQKVQVGKGKAKEVRDDSEVIEFWKQVIENINNELKTLPAKNAPEEKPKPDLGTGPVEGTSDLPF